MKKGLLLMLLISCIASLTLSSQDKKIQPVEKASPTPLKVVAPADKQNVRNNVDFVPYDKEAELAKHNAQQDKIWKVVEQNPQYMGGDVAMHEFITKNLQYPAEAKANSAEGKVYVQFVVEKDGSISDVRTLRDAVGHGASEEAIRVVSAMPKWTPGKQDGQTVRVQYVLPFNFALTDK